MATQMTTTHVDIINTPQAQQQCAQRLPTVEQQQKEDKDNNENNGNNKINFFEI